MTKSGKSSALSKPWPIGAWLMKLEPRRKRRIQETTITEGDTITNNYTIYYLVDGSGSENEWTETSATPATCTVPGSKLLTCSKCQQTKKEAVPALGHDWQVKQTVTTEYDDTGQLIQEGYHLRFPLQVH